MMSSHDSSPGSSSPPAPDAASGGTTITICVEEDDKGVRLDKLLTDRLAHLPEPPSRSRIRVLIETGQVREAAGGTSGMIVEPSAKVKPGAAFTVTLPPPAPAEPQAQDIPLTIVYEDETLIVIDKPAGLVVHPAPGNPDMTLVNALLAHCPDGFTGIGGEIRPGIVHRIDKDTSGLLVVAKTEGALKALQAQFAAHGRDGRLSRAYIAFVWGKPGTFRGTIDAPLGRSAQNRRKMAVRKDGREAITHFQVAESYGEPEALVSRLVCRLETGRTHQIRVHLTHKGHPLLGDPIYGGSHATRKVKLSPDAQACLAALGRQALHACELGFEHPVTGEQMLFESPLPADLAALEAALRQT